jgi:imidazolonepropionase-like amidohydrolase
VKPLTFTVALMIVASMAGAQSGSERIVTDIRLVDPVEQEVRAGSLHLAEGRIVAIGSPEGDEFPAELPRWRGEGRFALAGLFDASVYGQLQVSPGHRDRLQPDDTARLLLAAGVTTYIDLDASPEAGVRRADSAVREGARALRGGPVLTALDGVGSEIPGAVQLRDVEHAHQFLAQLLAKSSDRRPDRLSVMFDRGRNRRGLAVPILDAILEEAGDLPVAVYVGTWRDAHDALGAGARWLVQIPPGSVPQPLLEQVALIRPHWTPALSVGMDFMALMADEELRNDEAFVRALPPEMRADYGQVRVPQGHLTEARLQNEDRLTALVALDSHGVRWVGGSQSGGLGTAHGWSLLREFEWWGRAGLSPWTVLLGATLNGTELMGLEAGLKPGATADFVLYKQSPVEEIGELGRPEVVFMAGEPWNLASLAAAVHHSLTEEVPADPLPGGNLWSLLIIAVSGFTVLLFLRHLVRRAAANTLEQ